MTELEALAVRERPSRHGVLLGQALSKIEAAGRELAPDLPDMCATCAYRDGCMTNMMAATGKDALNCFLGIDPALFGCHHGMMNGEPTKLCAGYLAAKKAPTDFVRTTITELLEALDSQQGPDTIREDFDAWVAEIDPTDAMDDYARGRAFLRARAQQSPAASLRAIAGTSQEQEG